MVFEARRGGGGGGERGAVGVQNVLMRRRDRGRIIFSLMGWVLVWFRLVLLGINSSSSCIDCP